MRKFLLRKTVLSVLSVFALASAIGGLATIDYAKASAEEIVYVQSPGASIKLTGESGIRFPMFLTSASEGKTVEDSYTVIIPADLLADGALLDKDTENASVVDTTNNWQDYSYENDGEVTTAKATFVYLYGIPSNSYTREIAFRSYVKFTDGTEGYSEQLTRSIASVANAVDPSEYEGEKRENLEKYRVSVAYGAIMDFADGVTLSESASQAEGQAPALWANYYRDFDYISWGVTVNGAVTDVNSLTYVTETGVEIAIDVSGLTSGVKSIVTTPISALTENYAQFKGEFKADIASGSGTTVMVDRAFAIPATMTETESNEVSVAFDGYETAITSVTSMYGNKATVNGDSFTASGADKYTVACTVNGYAYKYSVDCFMQSGTDLLVNADTYRGISQVKAVSNCEVGYTTAEKYGEESGSLAITVTQDCSFIDFDISSLNTTDITEFAGLEFAVRLATKKGTNKGYTSYLMPDATWNIWHSQAEGWQIISVGFSTFMSYDPAELTKFRIQISSSDMEEGDAFYLGAFRLKKADKKISGVETTLTATTAEYALPAAKVFDQYNNVYEDSVSCKVTDSLGAELTVTDGKVTFPVMGKYTLTYSAAGYSDLVCSLTYAAKSDRTDVIFELDTYYGTTQGSVQTNTPGYATEISTLDGVNCMMIGRDETAGNLCWYKLINPNITDLSGYTSIQVKVRIISDATSSMTVYAYNPDNLESPIESTWTSTNVTEWTIITISVDALTNKAAFNGMLLVFELSGADATTKICISAVTLVK